MSDGPNTNPAAPDSAALQKLLAKMAADPEAAAIGQGVYTEMMGHPPEGDLSAAVEAMDADEQAEFLRTAGAEVSGYTMATASMVADQGRIDKETLSALSKEDRSRVALLRMTTRPLIVRWLVLGLMSPFIVVALDVFFAAGNVIFVAFGNPFGWNSPYGFLISEQMFKNEGLIDFYKYFAGWSTVIITSYFGLRQWGKAQGHTDEVNENTVVPPSVTQTAQTVANSPVVSGALDKIAKAMG